MSGVKKEISFLWEDVAKESRLKDRSIAQTQDVMTKVTLFSSWLIEAQEAAKHSLADTLSTEKRAATRTKEATTRRAELEGALKEKEIA